MAITLDRLQAIIAGATCSEPARNFRISVDELPPVEGFEDNTYQRAQLTIRVRALPWH